MFFARCYYCRDRERTDLGAPFEFSQLHDAKREETMGMAMKECVNRLSGWLNGSFQPIRKGSSQVGVDH